VINLEIKGFIPNTMLDWEGMLASTIFLPRCNFRCPFCQNPDLVLHPERLETVPLDSVKFYISEREGWVEGVCITGGEPCLHEDLAGLCADIKSLGVGVKLDTNGSIPEVLERLLEEGLLDYVSMDVKAPLEPGPYRLATGLDRADVRAGADLRHSARVPDHRGADDAWAGGGREDSGVPVRGGTLRAAAFQPQGYHRPAVQLPAAVR
jgi:pyruvate formate lyase activating enzyme